MTKYSIVAHLGTKDPNEQQWKQIDKVDCRTAPASIAVKKISSKHQNFPLYFPWWYSFFNYRKKTWTQFSWPQSSLSESMFWNFFSLFLFCDFICQKSLSFLKIFVVCWQTVNRKSLFAFWIGKIFSVVYSVVVCTTFCFVVKKGGPIFYIPWKLVSFK